MSAVKLLWALSRDMPENEVHAEAEPAHVAIEFDPRPRLARTYSAESDHGPLKTSSAPPPVTQPAEEKALPPLNEAVGYAAPVGV